MSKIKEELFKTAGIQPKRGESEKDFIIRMQKAISDDITDEQWEKLSSKAQDWNNDAVDAINKGEPLPPFPDEVKKEAAEEPKKPAAKSEGTHGAQAARDERVGTTPEATGRTRGSGVAKAFKLAEGANVVVTTKRGKSAQGIIVELTDDIIVINKDGDDGDEADDLEYDRAKVTIEPSNTPEALSHINPQEASSALAEDPNDENADPDVDDTVEVVTQRDKKIIGKVVEVGEGDDDTLVIKDAAGNEHELSRGKLKSVVVKVRAEGSVMPKTPDTPREKKEEAKEEEEPKPAARRRGGNAPAEEESGGDEAPAEKPKRTRSTNEAGAPSAGNQIREMVIQNPKMTPEKIHEALTKKGVNVRLDTVKLVHKDTHYTIELHKKHAG